MVTRGRLETGSTWIVTTVEFPLVNTTEPTQKIMMFKWTVQYFFFPIMMLTRKCLKNFKS